MKRLLLCVGVLGIAIEGVQLAQAQHSLPSTTIRTTHRQSHEAIAENYIALEQRLFAPRLDLTAEQQVYLRGLSAHLSGRTYNTGQSSINLPSIDSERLELLKAISLYQSGQEHQAVAVLRGIEGAALYAYEQRQKALLLAYLQLKNKPNKELRVVIQSDLEGLMRQDDFLGEQARLYLAHLRWSEGKAPEAQRLLEGGKWSDELLPEVEYSGALLSYDLDVASTALRNTQSLLSRYPEMRERPRLLGLMAYTYYKLGDYQQAIASLSEIQAKQELSPEEYYTLGASYYALARYDQALPHLQKATMQEGATASLARFAVGNIYQHQGEHRLAQLAFSTVADSPHSSTTLREQALYRLIELGYSTGYDVFGNQLRLVERLLTDYPNSQYKSRVLEIVRSHISHSSNYSLGLSLIEQLQKYGLRLNDLKQELYFKLAQQHSNRRGEYEHLLSQSIALGDISPAYTLALSARSELKLQNKQYKQAEADARLALRASSVKTEQGAKQAEYLLAYSLFNQKRYAEAEQAFSQYVASEPKTSLHRDAYLRLGDCSLANQQNDVALKYYNKANAVLPEGSDEALYRIAHLHTKQGKYKQAIEQINLALARFPESAYLPQLLYYRGRSERLLGNTSPALATFADLARAYPASSLASTALLECALIYSNLEQDDKAIGAYKQVLQSYPQSHEAETALSDLKSLYAEQNRQEEYLAYVKSLGTAFQPTEQEEVQLKFQALEQRVNRGDKPTQELETFIKQYPASNEATKAQILLSEFYANQGERQKAITLLKSALSKEMPTESKLRVQLALAEQYQEASQLSEAYTEYQSAYQQAKGTQRYSLQAGLGVLRTANSDKGYAIATAIAKELLKRTNLTSREREELTLLQGKAEERSKGFNAAMSTYATLAKSTDSPFGAEATFRRADILYRLGRNKDCLSVLDGFIASGSSQDYWMARAFILLSDSYYKQGDKYLAKQYLESLKENYSGEEPDIHEMIEARLTKYSK